MKVERLAQHKKNKKRSKSKDRALLELKGDYQKFLYWKNVFFHTQREGVLERKLESQLYY